MPRAATPAKPKTAAKSAAKPAAGAQKAETARRKTPAKPPARNRAPARAAASSPKAAKGAATAKRRRAAKARKLPFGKGEYVVYPTHGVGKVTGVKRQTIAGFDLQLFVIVFNAINLTLRVPVEKTTQSGLRKISSRDKMRTVVSTLKGRPRSRRTMWSRRAQEYDAKINSGDPVQVAEVVRDLYRAPSQPEQSYSERQMYETALARLVEEYALVQKLDVEAATAKIEQILGG